jgi:DNA-binding GntR family transcriptional regulator
MDPAMLLQRDATQLADRAAGRAALPTRIRDRLLAPGARACAVGAGVRARCRSVSPSTVVAAYDQLLAQGLVEARRNRGFFVRDWTGKRPAGARPPSAGGFFFDSSQRPLRGGAAGTRR